MSLYHVSYLLLSKLNPQPAYNLPSLHLLTGRVRAMREDGKEVGPLLAALSLSFCLQLPVPAQTGILHPIKSPPFLERKFSVSKLLFAELTLMLGKIEGGRRRGRQRMRWLDGITNQWTWFGWTPGVGDGQGGLVCCSPWGHKESDRTEQVNWTELSLTLGNPVLEEVLEASF